MDSRAGGPRRPGRRDWLAGAVATWGTALASGVAIRCRDARDARTLRIWAHQGQEAENRALRGIAAAFDRAHAGGEHRLELSFFPDFHYTEKLSIAAAARDMPDCFEVDGPLVARLVDARLLAPLDPFFAPEELDDFLPTIRAQGSVGTRTYALGAFDSAAVLYFDQRQLAAARVRVPAIEEGFLWPDLLVACEQLAASGFRPLALHMNESADEWFTYAFSPLLWSAGGRLISADGQRVRGVLASAENVATLRAWQQLFVRGFALTDPVDPDPFGAGKVAMDWSGHWMARSHLQAKGDALGVMALPHTGARTVAACGSYCWAVSAYSNASEFAGRWVRWVTDATHGILPLVAANGAVPARLSAFAAFPEYARLPYSFFRRQLQQNARPRPRTPFYATLTQRFAAALRDIAHGSDVGERLQQAEEEIQRVIDRRLGSPRRGAG
jgi:multiple sugar transport system substrate-binding protein